MKKHIKMELKMDNALNGLKMDRKHMKKLTRKGKKMD